MVSRRIFVATTFVVLLSITSTKTTWAQDAKPAQGQTSPLSTLPPQQVAPLPTLPPQQVAPPQVTAPAIPGQTPPQPGPQVLPSQPWSPPPSPASPPRENPPQSWQPVQPPYQPPTTPDSNASTQPVQPVSTASTLPSSRITLFASAAIGGIWNYAPSLNTVTNEDGTTVQQVSLLRVSQGQFLGGLGLSAHAIDSCQFASPSSCADILLRAQVAGGYQFERKSPTIVALAGIETDIYITAQRRVAITAKIDLGFEHVFIPALETQQATISPPFWLEPSSSNSLVIAASAGVLVHLGSTTDGLHYGISADIRTYFSGGWFGLLVPIEFRYRF